MQMSAQWVVRDAGRLEGRGRRELGDDLSRGRRSSDQKRSTPTPAPPNPRRTFKPSTADPPGVTTTTGMGMRNLLRKDPNANRPKILFYNKNEPHYGFTNFSPHSVLYRGKRYPTSEHLFQSLKVADSTLSVRFFADLWTSSLAVVHP